MLNVFSVNFHEDWLCTGALIIILIFQMQILLTYKAELENDVKNLNDKLFSALAECNAKDDLVKKHAKMAQEAITGNLLKPFYSRNSFNFLS